MIALSEITHYFNQSKHWIYPTVNTLIFSILFIIICNKVLNFLLKKAVARDNIWNESFINASIKPISIITALTCGTLIIYFLPLHESVKDQMWFDRSVTSLYILLVAWFFLRFITCFERISLASGENQRKKRTTDITTVITVAKLIRIIVAILVLLTLMQTLGYSISGLVAFGGIGGIAVGFAAKDLLANFFGGLTIYMDNPFKVGDWIRTLGQPIEGTVEYIGWRQTRIRTFDLRPLHVPNSAFVSMPVENPSRMQNRRIKTTISLRYQDSKKLEQLMKALRDLLKNNSDLDHKRTTFIYFNGFGIHSLNCQLYCFTKTKDWIKWLSVKENLFLAIIKTIHQHDADLAFPTTTIDWPEVLSKKAEE